MRVALALVFTCVTGLAAAQDTLEPIRELYATADYEGALTALGRLQVEAGSVPKLEIDRYRVFCLVALGRSAEAGQVIEGIVTEDPLYHPSSDDAPPRIRAAFTQVRRRLLPTLVRRLYAEGKAAYDQKAFPEAVQTFEKTLKIIDAPDTADHLDLADLRTLAVGFLQLSRASIVPARAKFEPSAGPAAVVPRRSTVAPASSEPVALRQILPPWTHAQNGPLFDAEYRGTIEVDIDERGQVVNAEITMPIHPLYDPVLLLAARDWKYEPARRNGQPVKIRKRVDVVLRSR
jgi:hypothetical protein